MTLTQHSDSLELTSDRIKKTTEKWCARDDQNGTLFNRMKCMRKTKNNKIKREGNAKTIFHKSSVFDANFKRSRNTIFFSAEKKIYNCKTFIHYSAST